MNGRAISGPLIHWHPSAPVICRVRRLPLKETNVIAVRPLRWTDDRAALLALDTSFTTDRIFRLERTDNGVTLDEVAAVPPIYKSYSLAGATDVIAGHDWVQVAEYDDGFAGVASMTIENVEPAGSVAALVCDARGSEDRGWEGARYGCDGGRAGSERTGRVG